MHWYPIKESIHFVQRTIESTFTVHVLTVFASLIVVVVVVVRVIEVRRKKEGIV